MTIWLLILKIHNLSYKGVFSFSIYYIKCIPTKTLDRADIDKDYLYLFLDDIDVHIEENDRIKYLVFTPTERNKEALKKLQKTLGRN